MHIGSRIRDRRLQRQLTQEQLAAQMQVRGHAAMTQPRLAEIELGHRRVNTDELITFARLLDVRITDLLGVPDYAQE